MASVKIYLKTNKVKSDGSHPIVLQIIKDRKRKFIWPGYYSKPDQWDEEENLPKKNHPNATRLRNFIRNMLSETEGIILDLENMKKPFTVDDIVDKLTADEKSENIIAFADKVISKMVSMGQNGNAGYLVRPYIRLKI